MKKWLKLLLVLSLMSLLSFGAVAAQEITVIYDGEEIAFTDAHPRIMDGRTMVPFRRILETMGATVGYDHATKEVTAALDDVSISFIIGERTLTIADGTFVREVEMDVAPQVVVPENRTMVPVRFIAEGLNMYVGWDHASKTVVIVDTPSMINGIMDECSMMSTILSEASMPASRYTTTESSYSVSMSDDNMGELLSMSLDAELAMRSVYGASSGEAASTTVISAPYAPDGVDKTVSSPVDASVYIGPDDSVVYFRPTSGLSFVQGAVPGFADGMWLTVDRNDLWEFVYPDAMDAQLMKMLSGEGRTYFLEYVEGELNAALSGLNAYERALFVSQYIKGIFSNSHFEFYDNPSDDLYVYTLTKSDVDAAMSSAAMLVPGFDFASELPGSLACAICGCDSFNISGRYVVFSGGLSVNTEASVRQENTVSRYRAATGDAKDWTYSYDSTVSLGSVKSVYSATRSVNRQRLTNSTVTHPGEEIAAIDFVEYLKGLGATGSN